ncbi:patatin-like phospholipase family protein [Paraburkholderia phymatum]|uniref:Patatin-like phospholipase family protein n=1 Tax=Paraburkholderia phymatum TaxID=148447 RepID=A0ACC6U9V3_9BURK
MFPLRFPFGRRSSNTATRERQEPPKAEVHDERTDAQIPESFRQVELDQIKRHHEATGLRVPKDLAVVPGLAISGGGIRSAVFSLGVLQALADRHVLNKFGYISTVSGGSYIGAFYGSMFVPNAVRDGNEQTQSETFQQCARSAETTLNPETPPTSPDAVTSISYLRDNCDYLAPNGSDDFLQSIAFSLRNWFALQYVIGVSLLTILLFVGFADKVLHLRGVSWNQFAPAWKTMPAIVAGFALVGLLSPLSRAYWLTQNLAQETRFFYKFLPAFSMISVLVLSLTTLEVSTPNTLHRILTLSATLPRPNDYISFAAWSVICSEILAVFYYFAAWWYIGSNPSDNKSWFPGSSNRRTSRSDSRAYVDRVRNALTNAYTNPLRFCGRSFLTGPAQLMLWATAIALIDYAGYWGDKCIHNSDAIEWCDKATNWFHLPIIASSAATLWAIAKFLLAERKTITSSMPAISRLLLATVAVCIASVFTLVFWSVVAHAIVRALTGC